LLAFFGFGLLGFGLSVIIPQIYRLAGKMKLETSFAISGVSNYWFCGFFLVGPVILGAISV
jgi:hypothetical protein